MKNLVLLLALLFGFANSTLSQSRSPLDVGFTLTASDQIGPNPANYVDIRGTGITIFAFTWSTTGTVSAGDCALQGGTDSVTFGTTIITAQTVTTSGGPTTLTTGATSNYIRVNCTTPIAGSGSVQFRLFGWAINPSTTTATLSGAIPAGTNNIGDVDVLTLPALPAGTNNIGVVVPFPGTLASGVITTAMTGTTSTSLISATASNFIYITSCQTSNASTTVSTDIVLQDGSGGTTIATLPTPAAAVATTGGGGGSFPFPVPLKVPTAGNALFAANVTTGSSTKISCQGFKSTVSY